MPDSASGTPLVNRPTDRVQLDGNGGSLSSQMHVFVLTRRPGIANIISRLAFHFLLFLPPLRPPFLYPTSTFLTTFCLDHSIRHLHFCHLANTH